MKIKSGILFLSLVFIVLSCGEGVNADLLAEYFFADGDTQPHDNHSSIPSDGLVLYYNFNGSDASDSSGNGITGQVIGREEGGVGFPVGRKGGSDRCLQLYGDQKGWITVPHCNDLVLDRFTVNVWVYSTAADNYGGECILCRGDATRGGGFYFGVRSFYLGVFSRTWYTSYKEGGKEAYPSTGVWHMITAHVDGTHYAAYIDGILYQEGDATNGSFTALSSTEDMYIGLYNYIGMKASQPKDPFKGMIDDLRIYNRALTSIEVQRLFKE